MSKAKWITENLKDGEHYAGLILGKDGEPDYHLILMPGRDNKKFTWDQAVKAAQEAGGELPTRREQALLYTNLKDQFQPTWYWSGEQYAASPSNAWGQDFINGYQLGPQVVRRPGARCPQIGNLTIYPFGSEQHMSITLDAIKAAHDKVGAMIAAFEAKAPRLLVLPSAEIELQAGEYYAGAIIGENGIPTHHLVLMAAQAADINWDNATAWAARVGGELPTSAEQALLFANLKAQFEPGWHWSCTQCAASPSHAWSQSFNYGYQYSLHKSYEGRARAVRRVAI